MFNFNRLLSCLIEFKSGCNIIKIKIVRKDFNLWKIILAYKFMYEI